jgi:putative transposase
MHVERSITGDETVAVLERRRGRARRAGAHPLRPAASRPRIRSATRAASRAAATSYIDPGAPWQKPYVESFNGRVRDELLDVEQFSCLGRSHVVIGDWREDYNRCRPHFALPPAS